MDGKKDHRRLTSLRPSPSGSVGFGLKPAYVKSGRKEGGMKTKSAYEQAERRRLIKAGYVPIRAKYDTAGNCLTCGECGRCPGYHPMNGKGDPINWPKAT